LYFRNILKHVRGRALDYGCGAGELLKLLPVGSSGTEISEHAIAYCRKQGLDVARSIPTRDYTTFIANHILEHLDDPRGTIRDISKIGCVQRMIIVTPNAKGFKHDSTHRTFIDENYPWNVSGFEITSAKYFPLPKWLGSFFTYNELVTVLDRT
jgi:2-polyprenyl-3-methyl-5-hydroxy-6-metoxy-1,4-benzoquinol methylase